MERVQEQPSTTQTLLERPDATASLTAKQRRSYNRAVRHGKLNPNKPISCATLDRKAKVENVALHETGHVLMALFYNWFIYEKVAK
jgi:hypothetical protein